MGNRAGQVANSGIPTVMILAHEVGVGYTFSRARALTLFENCLKTNGRSDFQLPTVMFVSLLMTNESKSPQKDHGRYIFFYPLRNQEKDTPKSYTHFKFCFELLTFLITLTAICWNSSRSDQSVCMCVRVCVCLFVCCFHGGKKEKKVSSGPRQVYLFHLPSRFLMMLEKPCLSELGHFRLTADQTEHICRLADTHEGPLSGP